VKNQPLNTPVYDESSGARKKPSGSTFVRGPDDGRSISWWASVRIAFGVIWLIDGVLEWQPADFHNFLQLITAMSQGQPKPVAAVINAGQVVAAVNPILANALLAALETAIGLSLITNVLSRWALRISVLLAVMIWVFGQGLGMVFMPGATDIQSGPLYVLVSLMLLKAPTSVYRRSYLPMR
jgi:nitrite reductase (NO-forming)